MPSSISLLPALLVVAAVLGLAVGSFLNVVIHRLPLGLSLSHPGSRCPSCGTPIRNRHNVPVLGWLVLRGRCYTCHAPIAVRYPLVEAGTAVAFVAVVAALVEGARSDDLAVLAPIPGWLWLTGSIVAAALIDTDGHRVPGRFAVVTPAVVAGLLVVGAVPAGHWTPVGRALVGGVAVAVLVAAILRGRIGLGPVGFGAAAGLALGAVSWPALVVGGVLCVVAALAAALSPATRRVPVVALIAVALACGLLAGTVAGY